jgi:hypothetical protein
VVEQVAVLLRVLQVQEMQAVIVQAKALAVAQFITKVQTHISITAVLVAVVVLRDRLAAVVLLAVGLETVEMEHLQVFKELLLPIQVVVVVVL